jgi:hypothetical protein
MTQYRYRDAAGREQYARFPDVTALSAWETNFVYGEGLAVNHFDKPYVSLAPSVGTLPALNPTYWALLVPTGGGVIPQAPGGLPALPPGYIFVGDSVGIARAVPVSGDVTLDSTGIVKIKPTGVKAGRYNWPRNMTVSEDGRITRVEDADPATPTDVQILLESLTLDVPAAPVPLSGPVPVNLREVPGVRGVYRNPTVRVDDFGRITGIYDGGNPLEIIVETYRVQPDPSSAFITSLDTAARAQLEWHRDGNLLTIFSPDHTLGEGNRVVIRGVQYDVISETVLDVVSTDVFTCYVPDVGEVNGVNASYQRGFNMLPFGGNLWVLDGPRSAKFFGAEFRVVSTVAGPVALRYDEVVVMPPGSLVAPHVTQYRLDTGASVNLGTSLDLSHPGDLLINLVPGIDRLLRVTL